MYSGDVATNKKGVKTMSNIIDLTQKLIERQNKDAAKSMCVKMKLDKVSTQVFLNMLEGLKDDNTTR